MPSMIDKHRASTALTAAALALAVCALSGALLLLPTSAAAAQLPWRAQTLLATLAVAASMHWFYLARAARLMGRHMAGWLTLSVLLFPIGSAAALVLLGWLRREPRVAAAL
jgi:hypothetical protein